MNIDRDLSSRTRYDYEIDLTVLAKRLWNGRKSILGFLLVFTIIGIFIGLFSPIEYTSKTVMVPQIQSKSTGLGGLGSLAAMAGFNLDALQSGSSELSPLVYPQIIQSFPFQRAIIHSSYNWNGLPKPVSLMFYYDSIYKINPFGIIKKYTIGLPQVLFKYLKHEPVEKNCLSLDTKSVMTISKEERDLRILLNEWLTVTVNSKEGYITLTAIGPEPLVCAQIALKAQQLLQKQVAEFKIDKAKQNFIFVQSLFEEKEKQFYDSQLRLANFRDQNHNLESAKAKTEEEKLQSEYQLAFSVYSEVAKQLENAKIKIKEDTPIFSIIEPVSIPNEKSKPKKVVIMVIWFFIGGILGVGYVFGNPYFNDLLNKLKSN